MGSEFYISDDQWAAIAPLLPTNQLGARRVDDRRVLSGIVHVLRTGCRWQDTPAVYGPSTTIYNRFHRWSQRGIWQGLFAGLVQVTPEGLQATDSSISRAHRGSAIIDPHPTCSQHFPHPRPASPTAATTARSPAAPHCAMIASTHSESWTPLFIANSYRHVEQVLAPTYRRARSSSWTILVAIRPGRPRQGQRRSPRPPPCVLQPLA